MHDIYGVVMSIGQHLGLISEPRSLFAVLITERLLKAVANR